MAVIQLTCHDAANNQFQNPISGAHGNQTCLLQHGRVSRRDTSIPRTLRGVCAFMLLVTCVPTSSCAPLMLFHTLTTQLHSGSELDATCFPSTKHECSALHVIWANRNLNMDLGQLVRWWAFCDHQPWRPFRHMNETCAVQGLAYS